MIPASYLYKNAFIQAWGDQRNMRAEPMENEPRGPRGGLLAGLLTAFLPLDLERRRQQLRTQA